MTDASRIAYGIKDGKHYITACPVRSGVSVGGLECVYLCRHFVSDDSASQSVTCKAVTGAKDVADEH